MTHSSMKKAPDSKDEPLVSTQIRNLSKEPILNGIFRHFVTSSLSHRHIISSHFFSFMYAKMPKITQFDKHKITFLAPTR